MNAVKHNTVPVIGADRDIYEKSLALSFPDDNLLLICFPCMICMRVILNSSKAQVCNHFSANVKYSVYTNISCGVQYNYLLLRILKRLSHH